MSLHNEVTFPTLMRRVWASLLGVSSLSQRPSHLGVKSETVVPSSDNLCEKDLKRDPRPKLNHVLRHSVGNCQHTLCGQ